MKLLSTKKLKPNQRELLLNAGLSFVEYDAIQIKSVAFTLPRKLEHIIITSQNGARAFIDQFFQEERVPAAVNCFSVGSKTTALLAENGIKMTKNAANASELAQFIAIMHKNETFTYFCGKQRRDELPSILKEAGVSCNEVVVYETSLNEQVFDSVFDGVLFYSPSGVSAFAKANTKQTIAFCIGETTATEAKIYFNPVVVSNATTIESTIAKAVNYLKK